MLSHTQQNRPELKRSTKCDPTTGEESSYSTSNNSLSNLLTSRDSSHSLLHSESQLATRSSRNIHWALVEFESHWVPLSYGLVPHLSKKLSKLPLGTCIVCEFFLLVFYLSAESLHTVSNSSAKPERDKRSFA